MKEELHSIKAVYKGVMPYIKVTAYELSAIDCSATDMSGYYGQESTLISDDPAPGYDFANWSVTGSNVTGNNVTFKGDITAKANYSAHKYNVTLQNDGHGTIAASKTTGNIGDTITLSNTPNSNYVFSGYSVTGATLTGNAFKISASDVTAKGWFSAIPTYTLTLQTDGHGTLTANKITGYAGDTVTLSTSYNTYYRFNNYSVTGGSINGNTFTFGNANATAKANFKVNSFTVRGTMYWINQFTGAYQGARDAYPELRITGFTSTYINSASLTGGIGTSYGATGQSKAGNFTGNRGWKSFGTYSATSLKKPVNCSAWRISAGIDVGGKHNQGTSYGYEDAARILTASVGVDGTGTAKTNSVNNGWFPSAGQGTKTGHFNVTATAAKLGTATNAGSYVPYVIGYNYGAITQGSAGFYSWAHNCITSFSGPWSASGIMP